MTAVASAFVRLCENHGQPLLETAAGELRCPYGRGHATLTWVVVSNAHGRPVGRATSEGEALTELGTRVDLARLELAKARKADLIDALTKTAGNVATTAHLMGVARQSVYAWASALGIDITVFRVGRRATHSGPPKARGRSRGPSVAQRLTTIEAKLDRLLGEQA